MKPTESFLSRQELTSKTKNKLEKNETSEKTIMKLTSPQTVRFHTDERAKVTHVKQAETHEEAELRKIKEDRERTAEEMKRVNEFYEQSKFSGGSMHGGRVYATNALTIPVSPNLATHQRPKAILKDSSETTAEEDSKTTQRKRAKRYTVGPMQLTDTKPFHLSTDDRAMRRRSVAAPQEFRSAAEKIYGFQHKTPKRFHSRPSNMGPDLSSCPKMSGHAPLTEPEAPNLRTNHIAERPKPKSTLEREVEYIRNHGQFRARPVNRKVMNSAGELGVPKVEKRQVTKAKEFNFHTAKRAEVVSEKRSKQEIRSDASSKRSGNNRRLGHLDRTILESKPMETVRSSAKLCVPKTPNLRTKTRVRAKVDAPVAETTSKPFKARPVPSTTSVPSIPQAVGGDKKLCRPKSPELESVRRHKECAAKREEQIRREREEERKRHEFRAKPVPNYSTLSRIGVSNFEAPTLSNPESPNLASVARHRESRRAFEAEVEQQREAEMARKNFVAREYRKSTSVFVPKKSTAAPTVTKTSPQASKHQAEKRRQFDAEMRRKREQEEKERVESLRLEKEREAEEIKAYRKTLVHKARPVQCNFNQPNLVTMPSKAELTMPRSPKLHTKSRRR